VNVAQPMIAEGRQCPQCSTRNPDGAMFCWQCYRPFPQPGMRPNMAISANGPSPYSTPIGSPIRPALGPSTPAHTKAAKRSVWPKITVAAIVLVALLGGKSMWENMNRTHLQVPATIGSMQRIDDPRLADAVQSLEKIASDNGTTGKAGFYGSDGVPSFFFAALEFPSGDRAPEDIFREFSGGFASGGTEAVIDLRSKTSATIGEATFICAKLKGKPSGSICMWVDSDIVGFVGAFGQGLNKAQDLTAVVRTSVET
jgi:hypothetical protein